MKKLFDAFERANLFLLSIEKVIIILTVVAMITIAFGQVLVRNIFQMGFMWVEQVTRILLILTIFVGASLASNEGRHISVDVIARYLTGKSRKFVDIISSVIVMAACFFLFFTVIDYLGLQRKCEVSNILPGFPDWIILLPIPYFFCISIFRSAFNLRAAIIGRDTGKDLTGEK